MFPMSFERQILEGLPYPDDEAVRRVTKLLFSLVESKIIPDFRTRRGTDSRQAARLISKIQIQRLEDEERTIAPLSLLLKRQDMRLIALHERLFDYLVFVLPTDSRGLMSEGGTEERKVLAFAQFVLRHQVEHCLYPEASEADVIRSDVAFALEMAQEDPTFYRLLTAILSDEMVGLRGGDYLVLIDAARKNAALEPHIYRMTQRAAGWVADLPENLFQETLVTLGLDCRARALGECWNRSRLTSLSLLERSGFVRKMASGFQAILKDNQEKAFETFSAFKDRWGLMGLFHELGIPQDKMEGKDPAGLFRIFSDRIKEFLKSTEPGARAPVPAAPLPLAREAAGTKSLRDRIEEAKKDPAFPPQVIELIEKNKTHAVGHSGAKYSELIETLLAIPWKKIRPITVSPQEFEEGLHRTHYGLERPKDRVCDFFANLIRRYRRFDPDDAESWQRTGSAFLFVGPPGVGKTSLAISMAQNLGIPYHKISLGGMRDESDLRGHGFTYEGSKPGAIVQGLIKMGCMNGMFILDEADKTEKFAIATLLEILDPEQNHLFHDKYTQTTVDIDLSNCHFVLTANTLETVPPPVVNRCEVVFLDRYSVEEKVAIARRHLIGRVRRRYDIREDEIAFDPDEERELIAHLVREYTHEPGVRELERLLRTLFFRIQRKELDAEAPKPILITRRKIKEYLDTPSRPWKINEEDRVGEMLALGVNVERGLGSIIPIQATRIRIGAKVPLESPAGYLSLVHATGNIEKVMDESRKVATTGILYCAEDLGIDAEAMGDPIHLHFMGGSTPKDGPSAGGAIALALASTLSGRAVRRDVAMTGEIDTQGRITAVGGIAIKLEAAVDAGCTTFLLPTKNLTGDDSIDRLPSALKKELQILTYDQWAGVHEPFQYGRHVLQVVAVDHVVQAARIAFLDPEELERTCGTLLPLADAVREVLADPGAVHSRRLTALFVKNNDEIPVEMIRRLQENGRRCLVLCWDEDREELETHLMRVGVPVDLESLDRREGLSQALARSSAAAATRGVDIVAPYFFLVRDGILSQDSTNAPPISDVRFFANNYAVQKVKIKGSKAALNTAWILASVLPEDLLRTVPCLGLLERVWCADLAFIPEKYRLDVKRAQLILNRTLARWFKECFPETDWEGIFCPIDTH
ncbi:MAG: AAA family ATPase [Desulfacinum sp.]|nr:AAA family ATPase [Desulfacinum sp.]